MFLAIDRIEGIYYVCYDDDEQEYLLTKADIGFDVKPSDILTAELKNGNVVVTGRDDAERDRRLEEVRALQERIRKRQQNR